MAKRIEMIAPFEVLRGNLSGRQKLEYAQNNNPAFDAPEGRVNYARNYKTRYIGAKRGSDGLTYFSVRQRNGVKVNTLTKRSMALLGGAGALRAGILNNDVVRAKIEEKYEQAIETGYISGISFNKYVFQTLYRGLQAKSPAISFLVPGHGNTNIYNPWCYTNQSATGDWVDISNEVLVKFWAQLATNPIFFTLEGAKGVAHANDTFANVISRRYNVFGLSLGTGQYADIVMAGENYVVFDQAGTTYGALAGGRPILENGAPDLVTDNFYLSDTHVNPWSD
jgi:hypothetical protein